jgi:FkbM family methyltransferase
MYKNKSVIQIGSHVENVSNDPIFNHVNETTKLILVEPDPYLFKKLKTKYEKKLKNVTNVCFINKAVSNFIGTIDLTIPSERNDFTKLPIWARQLTSVNTNHAIQHINHILVDTITVETLTIDELIKQYNITEIDLLHTTTEDYDYTILMNYSFIIKPKTILFKHKHMDGICRVGNKYIELSNTLFLLGYDKIFQNDENSMYTLP